MFFLPFCQSFLEFMGRAGEVTICMAFEWDLNSFFETFIKPLRIPLVCIKCQRQLWFHEEWCMSHESGNERSGQRGSQVGLAFRSRAARRGAHRAAQRYSERIPTATHSAARTPTYSTSIPTKQTLHHRRPQSGYLPPTHLSTNFCITNDTPSTVNAPQRALNIPTRRNFNC